MELLDVIGLQLGEAIKIIAGAGMRVHRVNVTSPPKHRNTEYDDTYRVVRVKVWGNGEVELLVCNPKIR